MVVVHPLGLPGRERFVFVDSPRAGGLGSTFRNPNVVPMAAAAAVTNTRNVILQSSSGPQQNLVFVFVTCGVFAAAAVFSRGVILSHPHGETVVSVFHRF